MASQGGEVPQQHPEYEFEDPIACWIDLCEACRIPDMDKRKNQVTFFLNVAKNSHWTHELAEAEALAEQDVDYTGQEDLQGSALGDTEPYSEEDMPAMAGSDYVEQ